MTSIHGHQLLEHHPDTIETVRKYYDLNDPKRMDEAIDILETWIQKQNHFLQKKCPRKYLETNIIGNKGSVERTKAKLDKLFTLRTIFPHLFEFSDIRNDFKNMFLCSTLLPLPKLTKEHYRVVSLRFESNEFFNLIQFTNYYVMVAILSEYLKMNDYSNGYIILIDYRSINLMDIISRLNILELKQFTTAILDGYSVRIIGIHIVTPSKAVDTLLKIARPLFGSKIGQRFHVHTDVNSVYEYIPKNILPVELGGTERSLKELQEDWIDLLCSKESMEFLNWTKEARVNESYRLTDKYDQYLSMSGTFRTINVD